MAHRSAVHGKILGLVGLHRRDVRLVPLFLDDADFPAADAQPVDQIIEGDIVGEAAERADDELLSRQPVNVQDGTVSAGGQAEVGRTS